LKLLAAIILILSTASAMAGMTTVEFASSIGSPFLMTDANWSGPVGDGDLYFKEYAARVEYSFSRVLGISIAAGWIRKLELGTRTVDLGHYHYSAPTRKFTYLLPSLSINTNELRAKIGTIIYRDDDEFGGDDFPFNSDTKFWPSFGVELGTREFYLLGGFINSLPLYSECLEIGFGGRFSGLYDQRLYLYAGLLDYVGFGYRGEFKIFKKNAIILGISIGGDGHKGELYTFTLGMKFNFGNKALPDSDL
jgi:hypothetical protein